MNGSAAAPDTGALLAAEARQVEGVLAEVLDAWLADWPAPLAAAVRHAASGGGKRFRPILCACAFRAASGRPAAPAAVYHAACALELIHAYSLVHDDLPCVDDSDLRRGRPTVHRVYGAAVATAAGAAMIPLACRVLDAAARELGLGAEERRDAVRVLCAAAGAAGMVGGQWLDLEAEGRSVSLSELERIHRSKTGALLAAAPALGGRLARAEPAAVAALERYGRSLGLAFQIADDLLDVTGRAAVLGKPAGQDAALGKATFPALLGVDAAARRAREESDAAVAALREAGIRSAELEALARFAVDRVR